MNERSGFTGDYILAVDIGTSFIKCNVYDRNAKIKGKSQATIQVLHPSNGASEIDPEDLWSRFRSCIEEALAAAKCHASQIRALGLCTQRGTFITWDKDTREYFHNFITWQDLRASQICEEWNASWTINGLNTGSKLLHALSRRKRYLAGSIYRLKARMVASRLLWAIEKYPLLKSRIVDNKVYFGCIGTWLLWKMTGKVEAEISLSSSTGMFDPFVNEWGYNILKLITVPTQILPPVRDTSHVFGYANEDLFGYRIPIAAMAGDQQAGMFGCCCFEVGSVKLTMGTGLFVDMNTGQKPHASILGIYPLVGWKTADELVYLAESSANDAGTAILWAQHIGLFDDVSQTAEIANSAENSGGVYFVPAFTGLQAPVNDDQACAMFVGLKAHTTKSQMVRAVLESVAFRVHQIMGVMLNETQYEPACVTCIGGVSKNDFICQSIADLLGVPLQRIENEEITALGVAFLAGLKTDFWHDKQELKKLINIGQVFRPRSHDQRLVILEEYENWLKAVERSLNWYAS